jgi:hypothetical protein
MAEWVASRPRAVGILERIHWRLRHCRPLGRPFKPCRRHCGCDCDGAPCLHDEFPRIDGLCGHCGLDLTDHRCWHCNTATPS